MEHSLIYRREQQTIKGTWVLITIKFLGVNAVFLHKNSFAKLSWHALVETLNLIVIVLLFRVTQSVQT